jgi:aryl-alcohol dehydrogenase-like predicted oxidoreductase
MKKKDSELSRRNFIKAGIGTAAGMAALGTGTGSRPAAAAMMSGMTAAKLPKSGYATPILGFGTATLMPQYNPAPTEEKVRLIRYGYDKGIRYFDTAAIYRTEAYVGEALKDVRDDVYLATKAWPVDAPSTRQQVEASLKNLQTDVIDCVKIHLASDIKVSLEVLDELEKLKSEGKVRHIGMSNHVFFEVALKLIETGRLDEFLVARGYFPKGETEIISPHNGELREMCIARAHELGMNIIGMKAMGGFMYGPMYGAWVPDYDPAKAARLPAAAIRWCFSDPRFHVYIIGVSQPQDVDENTRTVGGDLELTSDDRMLLAEFSTKVWESETVKLCPRPFPEPGVDNRDQITAGRQKVFQKVGEHAIKLLTEAGSS